jgi:hypothetical protein
MEDRDPSKNKTSPEDDDREEKRSEEDNHDQKKSVSGFFEKLILLIIGFALTTLVGGFLADRYRRESARTEFEIAAMQSDISRSVQVFENISQLMDKRLFRMRRLHDVFNGNIDSDQYPQRLADYRNVLIEWNDNVNRYRALYAVSFLPLASQQPLPANVPDSCPDSFEAIASSFVTAHSELQKLIDKKEGASIEKTKGLLDNLNVCIYLLDERMLLDIRGQKAAYKDKITTH